MTRLLVATLVTCLLALSTACQEEPTPRTHDSLAAQGGAQPLVQPPPPGSGTGATGLTWTVPEGWVPEPPGTRMRKAQYRVPGEAGDAECIVFYFGPGEGGDAMANAQRWAGQFTLADGRPGAEGMKLNKRTVGQIDVLTVEIAGSYQAGFGMQRQQGTPKANQMMLGAIAEGPDANWFFKLTGPEATVTAQRSGFEALVESLK